MSASSIRRRTSATGSPTLTSATRHRSTSRTRLSASGFSARSAPTKSSTNAFAGVQQQLLRRRVLGELAADLQDRDPVAHLDRLVDVVGDEDDRLADLGLQAQELVLEALAVDRVDRAERLVHQHQRRVGGERAGDADALALAAGELRGVARGHLLRQPDQVEQLLDAVGDPLLVPAEQPRDGGDVVARSCGAGTGRSAGSRSRSRAAGRRRRGRLTLRPPTRMSPLGDVDHPVDHPHRGGLAAAGRADEHADLAGGDCQGERVDGGGVGAGVELGGLGELQLDGFAVAGRPLGLGGVWLSQEEIPGKGRRMLLDRIDGHRGQTPAARRAAACAASSRASSSGASSAASRPSAVAVSQSANQPFLGSSGPCR